MEGSLARAGARHGAGGARQAGAPPGLTPGGWDAGTPGSVFIGLLAEVVVLTGLPLDDPPAAAARTRGFAEVGATRLVHAWRYADAAAFAHAAETLAGPVRAALR